MDLNLRRYAIKTKDWHLIRGDSIFKLTRERLEKGINEYPYLVFDHDEWSGSNEPVVAIYRDGKLRDIRIKVYESEK